MAGGYETPAVGEFAELLRKVTQLERRLDELERPGGTQIVLEDESERESASGFALGTSQAVLVTIPYTCPLYPTTTNFLLGGQIFARNSRAVSDFAGIQVRAIGSVFGPGSGNEQFDQAAASAWAAATTGYAFDVRTEPGETVTFQLLARATNGAWSADPGNLASLWIVASHKIRS
jgi:hypothetical protein